MTQGLRKQVITHVLQSLPPNRWYPDSITNITDIRQFDISSDSLEVSDVETPETPPSAYSREFIKAGSTVRPRQTFRRI